MRLKADPFHVSIQVEEVTKKYVKSVEEACKSKEKEILGNS